MPSRNALDRDDQKSVFFGERNLPSPEKNSTDVRLANEGERSFVNDHPTGQSFEFQCAPDIIQFTRERFFEELLRLRDDERERIGHELHDSAGQLLLYLQLSIGRLKLMTMADHHDELIQEIQDTARQIAAEIRSLAFLSHPARLSPEGLPAALKALIEGFGKRTGYQVSFSSIGNSVVTDSTASLALLRIAQEALVNIHRHAHASSVSMYLAAHDDNAELTIRDDGIGMPPAKEMAERGGVGVDGMRFRVEQLGGEFQLTSDSSGTKIFARIPLTSSRDRTDELCLNQLVSNSVPNQVSSRP